jgi:hypothetical protein
VSSPSLLLLARSSNGDARWGRRGGVAHAEGALYLGFVGMERDVQYLASPGAGEKTPKGVCHAPPCLVACPLPRPVLPVLRSGILSLRTGRD